VQLLNEASIRGRGGQAKRTDWLRGSYLYGGRSFQFSVVSFQLDAKENRKGKLENGPEQAAALCNEWQT
jgi:hypothetical protein